MNEPNLLDQLTFEEPVEAPVASWTHEFDTKGTVLFKWSEDLEKGFRWVTKLIARFTYKPGWTFDLGRLPESHDSIRLEVRFYAPDSRGEEILPKTTSVTGTFDVPLRIWSVQDEAEFWVWLHHVLEYMERHELDEWFTIDGKLLRDPHDPVLGERPFRA